MASETTPWRAWLCAAMAAGLAPAAFWRLSLKEWRALAAPAPREAMTRERLEALAARFPDEPA